MDCVRSVNVSSRSKRIACGTLCSFTMAMDRSPNYKCTATLGNPGEHVRTALCCVVEGTGHILAPAAGGRGPEGPAWRAMHRGRAPCGRTRRPDARRESQTRDDISGPDPLSILPWGAPPAGCDHHRWSHPCPPRPEAGAL